MNGHSPKFCFECGSPLPPNAKFCPQCGKMMHAPVPVPDPPAPTPVADAGGRKDVQPAHEATVEDVSSDDVGSLGGQMAPALEASVRSIEPEPEPPGPAPDAEPPHQGAQPDPPASHQIGYTLEGHGLQATGTGTSRTATTTFHEGAIASPTGPAPSHSPPADRDEGGDPSSQGEPRTWPGGERTLRIVAGMQMVKKMGMTTTYTIICTDQRMVFAKATSKMLSAEYSEASSQAKAQGKGWLGQMAAQMGTYGKMYDPAQGYARRYWDIQPDQAMFEDKANFMLPINQVIGVRVQRIKQTDNRYDDHTTYRTLTEVTINASGKTYKFRGPDSPDIQANLAAAYPGLVH